jgi:hypothetical protein
VFNYHATRIRHMTNVYMRFAIWYIHIHLLKYVSHIMCMVFVFKILRELLVCVCAAGMHHTTFHVNVEVCPHFYLLIYFFNTTKKTTRNRWTYIFYVRFINIPLTLVWPRKKKLTHAQETRRVHCNRGEKSIIRTHVWMTHFLIKAPHKTLIFFFPRYLFTVWAKKNQRFVGCFNQKMGHPHVCANNTFLAAVTVYASRLLCVCEFFFSWSNER